MNGDRNHNLHKILMWLSEHADTQLTKVMQEGFRELGDDENIRLMSLLLDFYEERFPEVKVPEEFTTYLAKEEKAIAEGGIEDAS